MLTNYSVQVIMFNQCIACGVASLIASYPGLEASVTKTVHSLLPQDFHLLYEQEFGEEYRRKQDQCFLVYRMHDQYKERREREEEIEKEGRERVYMCYPDIGVPLYY